LFGTEWTEFLEWFFGRAHPMAEFLIILSILSKKLIRVISEFRGEMKRSNFKPSAWTG
jgi:hypothetical protein